MSPHFLRKIMILTFYCSGSHTLYDMFLEDAVEDKLRYNDHHAGSHDPAVVHRVCSFKERCAMDSV